MNVHDTASDYMMRYQESILISTIFFQIPKRALMVDTYDYKNQFEKENEESASTTITGYKKRNDF